MLGKGVKVKRSQAEIVRKELAKEGCIDGGREVLHVSGHVIFPITDAYSGKHAVTEHDFLLREHNHPTGSYLDRLDLPKEVMETLPRSFDMVGDIAILKLADEHEPYFDQIGKAVMDSNKNLSTILRDKGVKGEWRVRDLELIGGDSETETMHKEYGCVFQVDVTKVYYSPRLATERWRVVNQVQPDEIVVDMFAGVGPFAIMISKHKSPRTVWAFDINPDAVQYLRRNIEINKTTDVKEKLGDAKALIGLIGECDRIIMNLPHDSWEYLQSALEVIVPGGSIHYYDIIERDQLDERMRNIKKLKVNGKHLEIRALREVRTYSPTMAHFGMDLVAVE